MCTFCHREVANRGKRGEDRYHATDALHEPVEEVLTMFRVMGRFAMPGGGNAATVGDPDISWVMSTAQPHVYVTTCVLVKPRWCNLKLSTKLGGRRIW